MFTFGVIIRNVVIKELETRLSVQIVEVLG